MTDNKSKTPQEALREAVGDEVYGLLRSLAKDPYSPDHDQTYEQTDAFIAQLQGKTLGFSATGNVEERYIQEFLHDHPNALSSNDPFSLNSPGGTKPGGYKGIV